MSKICLIAGCSHTVGAEIDGFIDSPFNRSHSYGNILAEKLGYKPINIAVCGYTNSAIARSVLEWFSEHDTTDVFVLIGWSESARIEAPFEYPTWYQEQDGKYCDWFSKTSMDYLQININHHGFSEKEKDIQEDYKRFIVNRIEYTEITSANLVLLLQYFLKYKNVDYLMCNTGYMFNQDKIKHLNFYLYSIDNRKYYKYNNNNESFYIKYLNLGYPNPKAKYGHHSATPHKLYADELYNFIKDNNDQ
jgi:hypothetical protein